MNRIVALLIGTWFGLQMAGYLIAPVLFSRLEPLQAGHIAGVLFSTNAYFGLFSWAFAFFLIRHEHGQFFYRHSQRFDTMMISVLLAVIAFNQFLITPVIEAFKNNTQHWLMNLSNSFSVWHGVSQTVYLISSILGLILLLRLLKLNVK
ncbi:MAG: DUF4149 domain-containing protein [Neisseria sp.]|nr:DUF4149 domain-containing protein [Neisseria sp.]